jgi:hypothetical protein
VYTKSKTSELTPQAKIIFCFPVNLDPIRETFYHLKKEVTDRSMEMKETLKRFQGKVFHAVNTTHGTMLRYR